MNNNENEEPLQTNISQTNVGESRHPERAGLLSKEDLNIVPRWVKNELFERVKFLYNPAVDLKVGGRIYIKFVNDCKSRFVGTKKTALDATPVEKKEIEEFNQMYYRLIWQEVTKKKENVVSEGLNGRRSSIYTSLLNKFVGTF